MKIFSVMATYSYMDKGWNSDSRVFPRAFRTRDEAVHAIQEDAVEVWGEMTGGEMAFPGVDTCASPSTGITYSINLGVCEEEASYSWEIIEQDFE